MNPAISRHAWERFITRWDGELPPCPMQTLQQLMAKAVEEDLGAGAAIRLMNHGLKPASYYACGDWRFVVTEGGKRLLTVERIIHRKPKKKWKPRRRR